MRHGLRIDANYTEDVVGFALESFLTLLSFPRQRFSIEPFSRGKERWLGADARLSFFESDDPNRPGLGNFIIMDHILRAASAGLPYVYLGYWIQGSSRMEYKIKFRPIERLGPDGWHRFDPEQALAPAAPPAIRITELA